MKTILALCLISAAFAIPAASASNCDPTYTVCEGSYGYGDCTTNGYASNYVSVYAAGTPVYASTNCGAFSGWYSYSSIFVYTYTPATGFAYAEWYSADFFGNQYCGTNVYSGPTGYNGLGCPAGGPPAVPAVLP